MADYDEALVDRAAEALIDSPFPARTWASLDEDQRDRWRADARAVLDAVADDLRAEAWDEGWRAAQQVVELDDVKCWAHTVFPHGYEGNPYRADRIEAGE